MRYHAIACDYDGTLAHHGKVDEPTVAALRRLKDSGRKLLLVTGRELPEVIELFPELEELFAIAVLENGALLYHPATREEEPLCDPPSPRFVERLKERGVEPLSVGRTIVATWEPHEKTVLEVIQELSLELQVIFNKGAVMILPSGVNKAFGLRKALDILKLSTHSVVGFGDAENDHSFLSICECSVAVSNALPALKEQVDIVTRADHGAGVVEVIEQLLEDDLQSIASKLTRHSLLIGHTEKDDQEVRISPFGETILVAGASGGGKSTFSTAFLEILSQQHYQFCVIDPEGDYEEFEEAVCVGGGKHPPDLDELMQLLEQPSQNVVADFLGVSFKDRPAMFLTLLGRLQDLRARFGRPHWVLIDEAHHVLPASWEPTSQTIPKQLDRVVMVLLEPPTLALSALEAVTLLIGVGAEAPNVIRQFAEHLSIPVPIQMPEEVKTGQALLWRVGDEAPLLIKTRQRQSEGRRHRRKYADGELPEDRSFFFRGPEKRLNLRAKNLISFIEIGEGVDDETWLHHLRQGDYSRWFQRYIKDEQLAEQARQIEASLQKDPRESRERIRELIETRYTLPATGESTTPGSNPG